MAVAGKKAQKMLSSSTISAGSDEDLVVYCQPCDLDGPRLPAYGYCTDCKEHLCESCFKFHKKHKFSRHHTLLNKDNMPKTLQLSSTSVPASLPDDLTKPCTKHKKEIIKFFCNDHKSLLCSVCVTLEHNGTSCKVNYIPDISGHHIDSEEYKDILKTMDTMSDQCQKITKGVKKMTGKLNNSLNNVLADIKKFRKQINQRLDKLEKQVKDTARAIQQENNKKLKTAETTCDDVKKSLKTSSDSIKHLNTSKQADKLFIELKHAEQMVKDYERNIQQLSAYDLKEYIFQPNEALSSFLEKEKSLGTLTEKAFKHLTPPTTTGVKSRQVSHQGEFCVRTSDERRRCFITGMTLLTPDLLIICDNWKTSIKLIDTSSQSVIDQLKLQDHPWDVTLATNTELAVTLPQSQTIQFISIHSNKLKKKHTLKVDGICNGISCYQGKLVVSFQFPSKLQILDMNGTVMTSVRGENTFSNPRHITSNSSIIYVSDWGMRTVTKLNWQGDVIGSYSDLVDPKGITLTDEGTVFLCDCYSDVIKEISGDCSTGKIVLKDQRHPFAACWCPQTNTLYVSCLDSDNLKCFKFQK